MLLSLNCPFYWNNRAIREANYYGFLHFHFLQIISNFKWPSSHTASLIVRNHATKHCNILMNAVTEKLINCTYCLTNVLPYSYYILTKKFTDLLSYYFICKYIRFYRIAKADQVVYPTDLYRPVLSQGWLRTMHRNFQYKIYYEALY